MSKHAEVSCPRCNQPYSCQVNSILKCDCMQIQLTREETQYIRDVAMMDYDGGCFCRQCLSELKAKYYTQLLNPARYV